MYVVIQNGKSATCITFNQYQHYASLYYTINNLLIFILKHFNYNKYLNNFIFQAELISNLYKKVWYRVEKVKLKINICVLLNQMEKKNKEKIYVPI